MNKDCFDCKYCGMDMDMDPYCVHPSVLKTNPYGSNINVVRGIVFNNDRRSKLPHFGLCKNGKLWKERH